MELFHSILDLPLLAAALERIDYGTRFFFSPQVLNVTIIMLKSIVSFKNEVWMVRKKWAPANSECCITMSCATRVEFL